MVCRYCGKEAAPHDPFRCQWHLDLFADHKLPLAERTCTECERRVVAVYRCVKCEQRFEIPGVFRWNWQGKGHYHEADDENAYNPIHEGGHVCVPVRTDQ